MKYTIQTVLLIITCISVHSQNFVDFSPRFDEDINGDIIVVGNAILGPNNEPFDGTETNDEIEMQYIDIDEDDTTFSSSSADVTIIGSAQLDIVYAGLYWSAVNPSTGDKTQVRFKGPNSSYENVSGTLIFDANSTDPIIGNNGSSVDGGNSFPYVAYADVTSIVQNLESNTGTYTVANVLSAEGRTSDVGNGTGHAAGWALIIVYEDDTLLRRSITSFDGFSSISIAGQNAALDVPVDGFRTPEEGSVRLKLAFAVLEGDQAITGDQLGVNGFALSAKDRSFSNFFNSSISQFDGRSSANRNPNSRNTLGFDAGILSIANPDNTVIENSDTSATINLITSGDTFHPYFLAFSVDTDPLELSVEDSVAKAAVILQPNPVLDVVDIKSPNSPITGVNIFDVRGVRIMRKLDENLQQLNISNLPQGIYFMALQNAKGNVFTKKIIKK